jgi:hypothetical protein
MGVVVGLCFAFAGSVAALTGLTARGRPQPIRKAAAPATGQKVLVLYDPADPTDVLVNGWDGRYGNLAFLAAGMFFIVFGIGMALGH